MRRIPCPAFSKNPHFWIPLSLTIPNHCVYFFENAENPPAPTPDFDFYQLLPSTRFLVKNSLLQLVVIIGFSGPGKTTEGLIPRNAENLPRVSGISGFLHISEKPPRAPFLTEKWGYPPCFIREMPCFAVLAAPARNAENLPPGFGFFLKKAPGDPKCGESPGRKLPRHPPQAPARNATRHRPGTSFS